jgi:hypothetical protein
MVRPRTPDWKLKGKFVLPMSRGFVVDELFELAIDRRREVNRRKKRASTNREVARDDDIDT